MTPRPPPTNNKTRDGHSEVSRKQSFSGVSLLVGCTLVLLAIAVVFAAPVLATILYTNYAQLPGQLQQQIYPDLYTLGSYQEQIQKWALWPATVVATVGLFFVVYAFLPQPIQKIIRAYRGAITLWAMIGLGIVFRLRMYLEQRSLWLDEVFIAVNFRDRTLIELLSIPLAHGQSAPPGFIVLVWASMTTLGKHELALRLVPLLFGIATLFIARAAANKLFSGNLARLMFVGIIAFSPVLIYYSQELKQYVVDAFATVVVIWMLASWERRKSKLLFGALGAVLAVLSLPAVLALVSLGVWLLVQNISRWGIGKGVVKTLSDNRTMLMLWVLGGLLHGWYLSVASADVGNMKRYWLGVGGFPDSSSVGAFVGWFAESFQQLVWLGLGHFSIAGANVNHPMLITGPLLLLLVIGVLVKQRGRALAVSLFALALMLAMLEIYPFFAGRLNIYLVPVLSLAASSLVNHLETASRSGLARLVKPVAFGFVLIPLIVSLIVFGRTDNKQDMRWLLGEWEARHESSDALTTSDPLILGWYVPDVVGDIDNFSAASEVIETPEKFLGRTIWIVSTHYGTGSIQEALERTHRVECEASPRFTRLVIMTPLTSPERSSGFCELAVPKF